MNHLIDDFQGALGGMIDAIWQRWRYSPFQQHIPSDSMGIFTITREG
jgi:hypothetical protein